MNYLLYIEMVLTIMEDHKYKIFDPLKVKVDLATKDNSVSLNHKPLKYLL